MRPEAIRSDLIAFCRTALEDRPVKADNNEEFEIACRTETRFAGGKGGILLARVAHFIERHPFLHRISLAVWKRLPARLAGILRGMLTTHWTVGAVAVLLDDAVVPPEVLLVRHSYRRKGAWELPGGSLESGLSSPLEPRADEARDNIVESALRREIFEELGIEIEIADLLYLDAVPYVPEEPGPYRLDFFYRCAPSQGFDILRRNLREHAIRPKSLEVADIVLVPLNRLEEYDLYSSDAHFLLRRLAGNLPVAVPD